MKNTFIIFTATTLLAMCAASNCLAQDASVLEDNLAQYEKRHDNVVAEFINTMKKESDVKLTSMLSDNGIPNGRKLAAAMLLSDRCVTGAASSIETIVKEYYKARTGLPQKGLFNPISVDTDSFYLEE
ncbi:MAG: hypothetical protein WC889_08445, partial [Myxococcota bacterium]